MKLTIIAATGGVGRQLLAQALDAGHDVTAVARNPAKLPAQLLAGRAARIVTADLAAPDAQVLESAVAGADAVLSALGPHNNSDAGIAAPGTAAIIAAMRAAGVRRIVAASDFEFPGEAFDLGAADSEQAQGAGAAPGGELAQVQCVGLAGQAAVSGQEPGEGDPFGVGEGGLDRGVRGRWGGSGHRAPPGRAGTGKAGPVPVPAVKRKTQRKPPSPVTLCHQRASARAWRAR